MNTNIGGIIANAAVNSSQVKLTFNIYQSKKVDKPQPSLSNQEKLIVKNWQSTNAGTKGDNLDHRSRVSRLIIILFRLKQISLRTVTTTRRTRGRRTLVIRDLETRNASSSRK